ncbi:MAG TPA: IclR family transcriptional regulator [Streptosporangiaceae bacterium]|nr:IclR family transcriptional regulator [Streptosporangiaceae bacterium]
MSSSRLPAAGDDDRTPASARAGRDQHSRHGIQAVDTAVRVLLALEAGAGPMSLSQIAAVTEMAPSKAHRYLVSLGQAGLVAQAPTSGLYDLGPVLRRLGAEALRRMDEVSLASEYLPGLRDRTRHSISLSVWGENGPIVVRWDHGAYALPINVRVGASMPLLPSALGRVFLAYLPEALTAPVLAAQYRPDDDKPLDDCEIEQVKATVRGEGVAFTSGTLIPGVASLAAPVLTAGSALPLCVSIVLPDQMATPKVLRSLRAELLATAATISAALGHSADHDPAGR